MSERNKLQATAGKGLIVKIVANKKSEKGASFIPSSAPTSNIVQELPKKTMFLLYVGNVIEYLRTNKGCLYIKDRA